MRARTPRLNLTVRGEPRLEVTPPHGPGGGGDEEWMDDG